MTNFKQRFREKFKPIKGYEGLYEISNLGRVKSFYHNWGKRKIPLIMKPSFSQYRIIGLRKRDGKNQTTHHIHKLIAQAFIKNPHPRLFKVVNHKDGNKLNNSLDNLEWCDKSHDMKEARRIGLVKTLYGVEAGTNKLTEKQVRVIKHIENCRPKMLPREVGAVFGVGRMAVWRIWKKIHWNHVII